MADNNGVRYHAWCHDGEPLWCPRGNHKLRTNALAVPASAMRVRCGFRETAITGECGADIFVYAIPYGMRCCADLTIEEIQEIAILDLSPEQMLKYIRSKTKRLTGH